MPDSLEEMHEKVRSTRAPAFAEFMDNVYAGMSAPARRQLPRRHPDDIGAYVNAIVRYALENLSEFEHPIKKAVAGTFDQNPKGERFILDSVRVSSGAQHCLFLDAEGELVTVRGPVLERDRTGDLFLARYRSYEVLAGPMAGSIFAAGERPLPGNPRLLARSPVASPPTSDTVVPVRDFLSKAQPAQPRAERITRDPTASHVFLSYASPDRRLARRVERRLVSRGVKVWIDEGQMQPGDNLPASIEAAIRGSTHFLPLVTGSAVASAWVARELGYARDVDGVRIVPLIAVREPNTELLDEAIGVPLHDTTQFEDVIDSLCDRLSLAAPKGSRDEHAMRRALAALIAEYPSLSDLDLTTYEAAHRLETLSLDQVDLHSLETYLALTFDLALHEAVGVDKLTQIASNVARVFVRLGAGAYPLRRFVSACEDAHAIHRVFMPLTDERAPDKSLIPVIQNLFELSAPPHHTVLKWFVCKNLDRMSLAQQRWAVSHFVARAPGPEHDAIITAFVFIDLMPDEKPLTDLVNRWVSQGKLGFGQGTLNLGDARIFFRCIAQANKEAQTVLKPIVQNFRYHVRGLARGRTLPELFAAAELVVAAKRENYEHYRDLYAEFDDAPFTAEWKSLDLKPETTDAFRDLARALEKDEDVSEALSRLYVAPRNAELVVYCSSAAQAAALRAWLKPELAQDEGTEAGAAVVIRGPSAESNELVERLKAEGYHPSVCRSRA